jgi:hypothetical protein
MKRRSFGGLYQINKRPLLAIAALALTIGIGGCSARAKQPAPEAAASPTPNQAADSLAPPGPEAKIQISYSQPNDFLSTLSLTKYSGAIVLATAAAGANGNASVVRFEGGTPIWQIKVEPGMFSEMPLGVSAKNYAISEVTYGYVPPHFVQLIPDAGPPEPLEPNHFYIFSVTRKSGSISYDAVRVNADGSLQAYEADPRAGTSFRLCCNVSSDFGMPAPSSALDTPAPSAPLEMPAPPIGAPGP